MSSPALLPPDPASRSTLRSKSPGTKEREYAQSTDQSRQEHNQSHEPSNQPRPLLLQKPLHPTHTLRIWIHIRELSPGNHVLTRRVLRVKTVLLEARLAEVGARDVVPVLRTCAVEGGTLEALAEVGVWAVRVGQEAAEDVVVGALKEAGGEFGGV